MCKFCEEAFTISFVKYKYEYSILGGTFDRLHKGHKHFLESAFEKSLHVTIGLASDVMLQQKQFFSSLEDYAIRLTSLETYLRKKNYFGRCKIIRLEDIYGNSLEEKDIDALFVTANVINNAHKINRERKKKGLSSLPIETVSLLQSEDGKELSSTRIRGGEIDRAGNVYEKLFANHNEYVLPKRLREMLRSPYGEVVSDENALQILEHEPFVIAVGDVVVSTLVRLNVRPHVSIYDLRTNRAEIVEKRILEYLPEADLTVHNKAGVVSCKAATSLSTVVKKCIEKDEQVGVKVIGEEDLLALPALLFAPLGSVVLYGLSGQGAVVVRVTEAMKKEYGLLLEKFLTT